MMLRIHVFFLGFLGLFLSGCVLAFFYGHIAHPIGPTYGGDFLNYWAGPTIAADRIESLFDFESYMASLRTLYGGDVYEHEWSYPLHSLFFFAPFSHLPYMPALLLWSLCGLCACAFTIYKAAPHRNRLSIILLTCISPASLVCLYSGQNGLFIAAGALGVLILIDRRKPWLAGIVLGCLTIKPHLFILWPLMLFMVREWRTIVAAATTAALLVIASLEIHGIASWQQFLTITAPKQWSLLAAIPESAGFYHFMMPGILPALRLWSVPLDMAVIIHVLIAVMIGFFSAWAFRKPCSLGERAVLLASSGLLLSPYAFNYDMVFLTVALLIRWLETPPTRSQLWLIIISLLTPALVYFFNALGMPISALLFIAIFYTTLRSILLRTAA